MSHKHDPNFNSKLNGKEKFGFRKLSIGLVAVALDTSFFVGSGQLVHAADDTATETVVQQGNASDSSSADTSSSTTVEESTSSESTTETAPAEKTNSESTETADKQATEPAKASAATTKTSIPELKDQFITYLNSLELKEPETGALLSLNPDDSGSFRDLVVKYLKSSSKVYKIGI